VRLEHRWQRSIDPGQQMVGTIASHRSNQKWDSWVSTSPLRGMPLGMMQSKAEMRSVATNSNASPRSKISRTFPLLSFLIPGNSNCSSGSFSVGIDNGMDPA
jgi:hypothetical protein